MKRLLIISVLACLSPMVKACGLTGVKGVVSVDGQSIASRQVVSLRQQALAYGGYQLAAEYLEKNRSEILLTHPGYSQTVKDQINMDLTKNVADLNCWARVCSEDIFNKLCQFY